LLEARSLFLAAPGKTFCFSLQKLKRKDSSFSEEKEAKRLFSIGALRRRPGCTTVRRSHPPRSA
jgi:hypothetical protein